MAVGGNGSSKKSGGGSRKDSSNVNSRRRPAAGVSNTSSSGGSGLATTFTIVTAICATFLIFGYILAHSHTTLGQYDQSFKFISNKIETIKKDYNDISQKGIDISLHIPPISLKIPMLGNENKDHHIIDPYDVKPLVDESQEIQSTNSIDSIISNIMHLIKVKEQPPPEVVQDSLEINPENQHLAGGIISNLETSPEALAPIDLYNDTIPTIPNPHKLKCPHGELLTFWRDPTKADLRYVSPYKGYGPKLKYVSFEPDFGGWNNIRMQMELVLVFAAATGRTLVLPPDQPMYLLHHGVGHQKHHNFADFFPFEHIKTRVDVISMDEYMAREGLSGNFKSNIDGSTFYPPGNKTSFDGTDRDERKQMWYFLRNVSSCPEWRGMTHYVVIPIAPHVNSSLLENSSYYERRREMFAAERNAVYYDDYWQTQKYLHFISDPSRELRLLEHFYTFLHFEDASMDRLYKRFVRDYVHYVDTIFCKAALIIHKLNEETNGSFSTFHIRRGEFQYKEVKISAQELMFNVAHLLPPGQLMYLATDEKNKSFFNDFDHYFPKRRYLDDYMDYAQLRDINPNFLGMIDQVICTRGQFFVGTWFSTFSGYITRMRGYLGYHDYSVYYGDKKRRDRFHHFELPKFPFYMREWNISWYEIDEA